MTEPRPSSIVREQLGDLAKVQKAIEEHGVVDFASKMAMQSVQNDEAGLREELRAAEILESDHDVQLEFDGDPVVEHTVAGRFFGAFLIELQETVNALAQVQASSPTRRGGVPSTIVSENRLFFSHSFQSSFGAAFCLSPRHLQPRLFESEYPSTLDLVQSFLDGQADTSTMATYMAHPRVKAHYSSLVNLLAKNGGSVTMRSRRRPYGARLSPQQARDRAEWLEFIQSATERMTVQGILVGANIEANRFDLRTDSEVLHGRMNGVAVDQVRSILLGRLVSATLEVETSSHEEAAIEPKVQYTLVDMSPA